MRQLVVLEEPVDIIKSAEELFKRIQRVDIDYSKEHFIEITLNTKHQIIDYHIISIGILDASLIHPREVFRPAIRDNAQSIIIAHNHPSGDLHPSDADKEVTRLLKQAADIIGIPLLDHIIFNETSFHSLRDEGVF